MKGELLSIKINVETSQKKEIANLLRSVADMIENSVNSRVTVMCEIEFNISKKKTDC